MARRPARAVCAALAVVALAPAAARAETFGSDLVNTPNFPVGCEARFLSGLNGFVATGQNTCTWFMGSVNDSTGTAFIPGASGRVPATGRVTAVRVRSQNNPAPLQVTILREIATTGAGYTCCHGQIDGPTFQPTPNSVTQVATDLPVEAYSDLIQGVKVNDIVAITALGPGSLPVHSQSSEFGPGIHNDVFLPFQAVSSDYYPRITAGQERVDTDGSFGFEVEAQYDLTTATCAGRPVTQNGSPGRDSLRGTTGSDVIAGGGGNDQINGRGGNDFLCGQGGKDRLNGGGGRDNCNGGAGKDRGSACERGPDS